MNYTGYYVKPLSRTTAPTALVSVVVTPRAESTETPGRTRPCEFGSAAAACSRFRRGRWTWTEIRPVASGPELLATVEGWAEPRRKLYAVAPVASDALTLAGFWSAMEGKSRWDRADSPASPSEGDSAPGPTAYQFTTCITRGQPDIIGYTRAGRHVVWLSGTQFFGSPEHELAAMLGCSWPGPTGPNSVPGTVTPSAGERCLLWLRVFQRLADWWRSVRGGPWGCTVGQLAERFWRSRLEPKTIVRHQHPDTKGLEARALWGGRASVWYYGDVRTDPEPDRYPTPEPPPAPYPREGGPLVQLDVASMYPWLLSDRWYPVRLLEYRDDWTPQSLVGLGDTVGIIANVQLSTATPEYPYKHNGRIVYPTGRFPTVLCGPELHAALAAGDVRRVFAASVYQMGRPFAAMASELLTAREAARAGAHPAWELFVKTLSNSFAGKLAQRKGNWVPDATVTPEVEWGEFLSHSTATHETRRYRSLGGLVFRWEEHQTASRPLGSCFAYLTSYGRYHMRLIRESLSHRQVVAQDTDGLWCRLDPHTTIRTPPATDSSGRGALRTKRTTAAGRWWGPQHYWTPDGWVLAGFHTAGIPSPDLVWADHYRVNPIRTRPQEAPRAVWEHTRRMCLRTVPVDGTVHKSGWQVPLQLRIG